MLETLEVTRMARTLAARSGERLSLIAENVANADTPGYQARDLPDFAETYADAAMPMRATRPGHLSAGTALAAAAEALPGTASPDGNTVSLESEMVRAAEVRQDHQMALAIYRSTGEIIRSALGRR